MEWKKPIASGKYGLQMKISAPTLKKPQLKKPLLFSSEQNDQNDDYSVEDDIARQATKKQYAREVELQHQQALEQDASVFDYDGVYDEMKGKQAQPIREDREKRQPKYIGKLIEQAKIRSVEHDIAYERNLAKERAKEDHLFPDKEKFVTKAYKQKLIEQGKWLEEERLREIREQAEEVTKRADLGDFYRNLMSRNVAYGATKMLEEKKSSGEVELSRLSDVGVTGRKEERKSPIEANSAEEGPSQISTGETQDVRQISGGGGPSSADLKAPRSSEVKDSVSKEAPDENVALESAGDSTVVPVNLPARKTREESLQAAKERYLARKRQRNT